MSDAGTVTVMEDGETIFESDSDGNHYYLTILETDVRLVQELMAALVSEPPNK